MRRTLAATAIALLALAAPATAAGPDPLQIVKDTIGECMDCIPGRCQILNSCEVVEVIDWP
jgi:hypothetical protein